MGFTGLIFGVIAAAWLIYLVPLFLNRRDNGLLDEVEPGDPFTASVTIVRRGEPLSSAENGIAIVSTPLNRRAALRELADLDRDAARRRRRVLLFLVLVTVIVAVFSAVGLVPWWNAALPGGLVVAFLVVARFSVRAMRRNLDARARDIRGRDATEETVGIPVLDDELAGHEQTVELKAPVEVTGSLWDPIPITTPTYVQKPLAPRTVRTIDLTAPIPMLTMPVTADAPGDDEAEDEDERAQAAG